MKLRISGINKESIVDGLGLRYVIFVQGCPHHCYKCHNPETHPFCGGELKTIEELEKDIFQNPLLKGVTFSGGEPFEQAGILAVLARRLKSPSVNKHYGRKKTLDIWCYTGYLYEELLVSHDKDKKELLEQIDILVDGKFIFEKKSIEKPFVGSSNQRVINLAFSTIDIVSELKLYL